jgi:hypothetical protein
MTVTLSLPNPELAAKYLDRFHWMVVVRVVDPVLLSRQPSWVR